MPRFETSVIHPLPAVLPDRPRREAGPVEEPLVLSSAFRFPDAEAARRAFSGESDDWIYGRWGNPTVAQLEAKLAALEGGDVAVAAASGMAAISGTLLALLQQGDHIVAPRALYAETARLFRERLPRFGIETTFVDDVDPSAFNAAIQPGKTKLIYAETPANPTLSVLDLEALAKVARQANALSMADNTFATPFCQRPLARGFDLVAHSMTKALCGHGDAIGGVVVARRADHGIAIADTLVKGLGGTLAPLNAMLIERGLRTLALRMERACDNALALARWLEEQPTVATVHYPGLAGHPQHELARRQMCPEGYGEPRYGALLAFELRGGIDAGRKLIDSVRLCTHAVSLGDVRTLITHPASTTASTMPPSDRLRAGITDGLLRLSVGVEHISDLIADLDQALTQTTP